MAFWGIEVKPGKPVTHKYDQVRGRLRVSQHGRLMDDAHRVACNKKITLELGSVVILAALGLGSATNKSVVQCNIGDKSPVILCVLLPDRTESCHLDLEFEEADDVIFSVIGPRSVHITGYYSGGQHSIHNDSSESYGVDIANSDAEQSVHGSEDDSYEDSFIDDAEPKVFSPSPFSSDIASDGEMSDKKNPKVKKASRKRLKKRYQSTESEDESNSQLHNHKGDSALKSDDEDSIPISTLLKSRTPRSEEELEKGMSKTGDEMTEHDNIVHDKKTDDKSNVMDNLDVNHTKSKKKRKERTKETPEPEGEIHNNAMKDEKSLQHKAKEEKLATGREGDKTFDASIPSTKSDPENDVRPKKKRKKSNEDGKTSVPDSKVDKVLEDDIVKQNEGVAQKSGKDTIGNKEDQKLPHDKSNDIVYVPVDENQLGDKKSKKKKKSKAKGKQENGVCSLSEGEKNKTIIGSDAELSEARTLSNGLIIQDLETGKPDGKIATSGKKVKVHYVGKLRDEGNVFDSNIGKSPLKFRLGAEGVTEGWNIGLDGMRVGGKRRLTIPPAIGGGSQRAGENVPPNSWLVYEFELLGVR